ncbi:MAG: ribosome silencing factor [Deltaproteobacteria bacterium]|nr:ribosome silencing factor [Deltaproteobacteria bacterium]
MHHNRKVICIGGRQIDSKEKAISIAHAAWEKQAVNPILLEVKSSSDVTDYFLICSANSNRGVKTIVDNIENNLKEIGQKVIGIEGYKEGKWVLVDSADVVIHIFHEPLREFYNIESLWIDAPRLELPFEDNPPPPQPNLSQELYR